MAIYEYKCKKCGLLFDVLQTKDKPKEICPDCSGPAKKVLSPSSYRMKGYSEKNGYSKKP